MMAVYFCLLCFCFVFHLWLVFATIYGIFMRMSPVCCSSMVGHNDTFIILSARVFGVWRASASPRSATEMQTGAPLQTREVREALGVS